MTSAALFCQVCCSQSNLSKYRCPACDTRSCSLPCVQAHKRSSGCSGRPPAVEPVPLASYDETSMRKDIQFLDQISAVTEQAARNASISYAEYLSKEPAQSTLKASASRISPIVPTPSSSIAIGCVKKKAPRPGLSSTLLRRRCEERQIRLRQCPREFSLHKENTSQVTKKSRKILWRIKWKFPEVENQEFVDQTILEDILISSLLKRFWRNEEDEKKRKKILLKGVVADILDFDTCQVLMQDYSPVTEKRYHLLNKELSILENLRHKTVLEFPVFYVLSSKAVQTGLFARRAEVTTESEVVDLVDISDDTS